MKIDVVGLKKSFGNKTIMDEFNLHIKSGEIVAVTGKSGSGKSTLLNIIGLIESYEKGSIHIGDTHVKSSQSRLATMMRRNVIGYIFQNYGLVENMTVNNNLLISLAYSKRTSSKKMMMIDDALTKVGLTEDIKRKKIYEVSGGEQQRIAIARLFLKPCNIILADEPTGSLDEYNKKLVIDLLKTLNSQGKTILLVTHDESVTTSCDRTISLA